MGVDVDAGADVAGVDPDVSRFLEHLESERRLSPRTIVSYRKDLVDLSVFRNYAMNRRP